MDNFKAQKIGFKRNHSSIFENVEIDLQTGEGLVVRGANGSGKSTLLRVLAGFLESSAGNIQWNKQTIKNTQSFANQMHYLGHQNGLRNALSVYENLHWYATFAGEEINTAKIQGVLDRLQLAKFWNLRAEKLSAGQARRLAIARLMLVQKPLWILDEPSAALDTQSLELLHNLIAEHISKTGIVIIATHETYFAKLNFAQLSLGNIND
jgi:heme exporter protein A